MMLCVEGCGVGLCEVGMCEVGMCVEGCLRWD